MAKQVQISDEVAGRLGSGPGALRFLVTGEVAELCRTSPETVRWWRHTGYGPPSFKLGRRVLYAEADVQAWIARHYDDGSAA